MIKNIEYIIHHVITQENAFVVKLVGNRCQDFVMPLLGSAVNIGMPLS